jgi:hypothetical protein
VAIKNTKKGEFIANEGSTLNRKQDTRSRLSLRRPIAEKIVRWEDSSISEMDGAVVVLFGG